MTDSFLTGRELARLFHAEVVAPLLASALPRLRYAAGRLGSGSDVPGLDDQMSRDHDWGCRLTLLVDARDRAAVPEISDLLERLLPESYRGFPVRFQVTWDTSLTAAQGWRDRESGLARACEVLLSAQGDSGLPAPCIAVTPFWDRPYRAVDPALPQALLSGITDPVVSRLPAGVGSIEQWIGNTDILAHPARRAEFAAVYQAWGTST